MSKPSLLAIKICENITKFTIYALVFAMPVFFLPWSSDFLDFNKQALFIVLIFVSLFAWMAKALVSGSFSINFNKINVAVGVLLLVGAASTIFSVFKYGSFWGWPLITSESLLSLICLAILYFLISNTFSEKEVRQSLMVFCVSLVIAGLYGILQLFGLHILPFDFTRATSFNTIGSRGALGIFAAVLMPLQILLLIEAKKWWRVFYLVPLLVGFVLLLTINYPLLWWLMLIGSALIIIFWIIKRDILDARWMFLPTFLLMASLFFIIFNPQLPWPVQKSAEVHVVNRANFDIGMKVLKLSPAFGSGPGTFVYDFIQHKSQDFNNTLFWNVNFDAGASKIMTMLATGGILGFVALLALLLLPIFYGIKYIFVEIPNKEKGRALVAIGALTMTIMLAVSFMMQNTNLSLDFAFFLAIALVSALIFKNVKTYELTPYSIHTLVVVVIFTAVFIFGIGFVVIGGQRVVANASYKSALVSFSAGQKDMAIKSLKTAISVNGNVDIYFSQLALFSLSALQDELKSTNIETADTAQKNKIQTLVQDAIASANSAVNVNPKNVDNWSTRGFVCQNLVGVRDDAPACAIESYDQAIALNPTNPFLLMQEGNVYLLQSSLASQAQNKSQLLSQANEKYKKALELKPDYTPAYVQMAVTAKASQDTGAKYTALENAAKAVPSDASLALQIALFYYEDKVWDSAQVHLERAVSLLPNYSDALYYLGLTYGKLGKESQAIAAFSAVLDLNPNNETVKKILENLRAGKSAL